ncbi:hypothetical protein M569_07432 [Genlisea aurea]|uniref:Uncharacterized protein n=1 Tax=Genlisea aurea TaxID=192259 RepID=S8CJL8_9LAMI|nr:hypothetical protein M569_07432 [Genlisea aurea]
MKTVCEFVLVLVVVFLVIWYWIHGNLFGVSPIQPIFMFTVFNLVVFNMMMELRPFVYEELDAFFTGGLEDEPGGKGEVFDDDDDDDDGDLEQRIEEFIHKVIQGWREELLTDNSD